MFIVTTIANIIVSITVSVLVIHNLPVGLSNGKIPAKDGIARQTIRHDTYAY